MVQGQVADQSSRSVVAIARSGNCQAIAYWLNTFLQPKNMFARVSLTRSGCLQVLVEFHPVAGVNPRSPNFRTSVVKAICHYLWQLNSEVIEGVQIMARPVGQREILWRQGARVVAPARKAKLAPALRSASPAKAPQVVRGATPLTSTPAPSPIRAVTIQNAQQLRHQIRQTAQQRAQFKALRSFFLTGSTAAAFIIGCWLGFADAPVEQTSASAHLDSSGLNQRGDVLQTAIGILPVFQQPVANPSDPTATLMFGGDVALTKSYGEQIGQDYQWSFAEMDAYRQADVAMVNLDTPFTHATTPAPDQEDPLKADPNLVQVLKNGGVDLVNLANSRAMDYATAGLEETLTTLQQAGIHAIGAGKDASTARLPQILNVKGQRIAYLGYDHLDTSGATNHTAGTNVARQAQVAADIKAVRDQVDWVVVNYHWGDEVAKYPGDTEVDLARFTIDQGADLVVGYHAQVLQGAELYKGRPIIYSLGNFVFGNSTVSDYDTAVLKVALNDKQMKVELLPVEVRKYQPRMVPADRGKPILKQIETVSDIFQQPMPTSVVLDTRTNTTITPALPSPGTNPPASPATLEPSPTPTSSTPLAPSSNVTAPASAPVTKPSSPAGKPSDSPWSNDSFITQPPDRHSGVPVHPVPTATASSPTVPAIQTADRATPLLNATTPVSATQSSATGEQGHPAGVGQAMTDPGAALNSLESPDQVADPEPPTEGSNQSPTAILDAAVEPIIHSTLAPTAIAPSEIPHPVQSLEPIKRRYAQVEPSASTQIADAILLPSE